MDLNGGAERDRQVTLIIQLALLEHGGERFGDAGGAA